MTIHPTDQERLPSRRRAPDGPGPTAHPTEEERYLFDLRGYLVVEDVLGAAQLEELNDRLDGYDLWGQTPGEDLFFDFWKNDERQISAGPLHAWDKPFRDLISHPRMIGYLADFLGPHFRYDHGHAMVMRKGGSPFGLHGGRVPWAPAISYEVIDGQIRSGLLVVQYALGDMGPDDGGFCALPGSHKANFACPAGFEPLTDPGPWIERVALRAGSALIFTEALTHGTLPWAADHERRALFYRYSPGHAAFVGPYREDGRERPGGAYPPADAAADDWHPLARRILEPPYVHERLDTLTGDPPCDSVRFDAAAGPAEAEKDG